MSWGRAAHQRAVVVGIVAFVVIVGGGVAAWAAVSSGSSGYRTADVTRADIATTLTVVGNVEPVSDATSSFQVGGKVATVTVATGQTVTAGQTLGTLDTTALSEAVSSAQSTVQADQAKLAEDEAAQSSAAAGTSSGSAASGSSGQGSAGTTVPASGASGGGQDAAVTQAQTTLTQDEATLGTDQQKEAADLAQAQKDCTSANTATTSGQATCEAALQTVSADEQVVSKDQSAVSKDESALGQALGVTPTGSGSGGPGSSPAHTTAAPSGSTGAAVLTAAITTAGGSGSGGTGGSGAATDTPQQIASDQASIDMAEAQLTEAQQSLNGATLSSPIAGTVVSVGINVGDTVTAGSSTESITIIGTSSYEALATLDSAQVPSVKVGQSASVEVDGVDGNLAGTVAQVGPVESGTSGYSYPVVVALPATAGGLHAGSAANVTISTGQVSHVVAVPTSAVQTLGSRTYVLELDSGQLTRKVVRTGMVGNEYTQVLSGLTPGQSVVLADYSEAVPSSSTSSNTTGLGNLLGGGGSGFPGGGAGFGGGGFFRRSSAGGG